MKVRVKVQVAMNKAKTGKVECWSNIDWCKVEKAVYNRQKRIYQADHAVDIKKVRKLPIDVIKVMVEQSSIGQKSNSR